MSVNGKLDAIHGDVKELRTEQIEQGKALSGLCERTEQHEKRMDRNDRRSAGLGAVTGALGGIVAGFFRSLFTGGH